VVKNYFFKIFKEISYSLYNIFEFFIRQELQKNYSSLIETSLRPDFFENYEKIIKEHKINEVNNREIIRLIMNNVQKSVNSLKFYSSSNLKYSLIKPYGDALNQLLFSFDRKSLVHFVEIFLKTILYEQLEANKKNNSPKSDISFSKRNNNNENCGSGVVNNIKESPPYLPEINPKLKYTLVLDIDETIIHYFFTYINGMFFVRPFVYEFLNELKDYYEIVTFTAGTKDYADNILNLVDTNDNLIKYRLYRHHTTIMGCNVFKDLMRLGRDMSKIIIIDNLKDNFKLQPNNGLFIKTWTSDINDNQLYDLEKILRDIALFEVEDVRPVIEKINDFIKISRNMINPYSNIDIRKILENINSNKVIK
jgi:CTD small phosphatase-like protein 2